jgi:hypothetical protein
MSKSRIFGSEAEVRVQITMDDAVGVRVVHHPRGSKAVKPLARRIIFALTLLCLLLSISLAALWLRGHQIEDQLWYSPARGT